MENPTIVFLNQLCEEANTRRKSGDWSVMRLVASNPAVQYYHDNVFKMGVNPQAFTYTGMFQECKAFHDAYLADRERERIVDSTPARINALENELKQLRSLLEPVVESLQSSAIGDAEQEVEPKPRKRARKSAGKTEPADEPAAEPDAEEDSEGESETTED